jgi:ATP adenylyltransferase
MPKPLWAPWRLEYVEQADESTRCIFCEPEETLVLHRGPLAFALLNRFPYTSGHLMVAPLRHVGEYDALTDAEALEIHHLATAGLDALRAVYSPHGHNLGWNLGRIAGAGIVEHVHLHVVPRWSGDTNFMPVLADVRVIPEALEESARRLREAWAAPRKNP